MNKIVVDCTLEKETLPGLIQAVKVFANKNKNTTIYMVADQKDLGTFKDTKNVVSIIAYKEGDPTPKHKDYITRLAWETMRKEEGDVFISASSKHEIIDHAKENLKEEHLPFFLTRFLSSTPSRFGFLGDSEYHPQLFAEEFVLISEKASKFLQDVFLISAPKYTLVSPSENIEDLSENLRDAYDSLEGKENFKKLTPVNEILNGKHDLYLADATTSQMIVKSTYQIYTIYHDKFKKYKDNDFKAKVAFFLGRRMVSDILSSTSARMDATGSFLLGYDKLVIKANPSTNYGGYFATLSNAQSYLNYLILKK